MVHQLIHLAGIVEPRWERSHHSGGPRKDVELQRGVRAVEVRAGRHSPGRPREIRPERWGVRTSRNE